jgi:hypothetical protein
MGRFYNGNIKGRFDCRVTPAPAILASALGIKLLWPALHLPLLQ